jgi:hypothetical protein
MITCSPELQPVLPELAVEELMPPLFSLLPEEQEEEEELPSPLAECCALPPLMYREVSCCIATPVLPALAEPVKVLFEKLASHLLMVTDAHEQKTTLILRGEHLVQSPLYGVEVTCTEFMRTAPRAFNIEVHAPPQARALIQTHQEALLTHLAAFHLTFTINRLEVCVQKESDTEADEDDE